MASYHDFVNLLGDRTNPGTFCNVHITDDSQLPSDRKSAASYSSYKSFFKAARIDVPKAEFHTIPEDPLPEYVQTKEFIKFTEKSKEYYDEIVEYDCDEEDNYWMDLANERRRRKKEKLLTTDKMELVMDRLEKESRFEVKGSSSFAPGTSLDTDDVCCICTDGDVSDVNQIIYCDMCNIAVHQECYGVPYIPEGQWLCRRCKLSPSSPVNCALCPNSGGAFKQTSDNRWAHVICAIWLNEVHFGNAVFLEPIEGVETSLQRRSKLKCLVCRKKMGACLQCSTRSCLKAFHVTCAQQSGMSMRVEAKPDNSQDGMDVQRFVFCHLHADDDDDQRQDVASRKKRMDNAIRTARRSMAVTSSATPTVNMPSISRKAIDGIAVRAGIDIADLVQFWYLKRKSRCGVPLIRRLQIIQKVSRVSISQEQLTEEEKEISQRAYIVRHGLETGRLLCEQMKKREDNKLNHLRVSQKLYAAIFTTIDEVIRKALEKISHKDLREVFAQPVTLDGYRTIIKHPMDISTMRKRLDDGKYQSVGDLRTDFLLMTDNCEKFNKNNEWYRSYGRKMRKYGLEVLKDAESRASDLEKLWTSESDLIAKASQLMFYDCLGLTSEKDLDLVEEKGEGEEPVPEIPAPMIRTSRRSSVVDSASSVSTVAVASSVPSLEKKNSFLSPREPAPKSIPSLGPMTPRSHKRKIDQPNALTPSLKRKRKEDITPLKQSSITKYFASPAAVTPLERRSSLRHAAVPLMAYRDNSVTSPLPADLASSESSADEDDPARPNRRSARLGIGEHAKMDIQDDPQGFMHNDLVSVDGIAGRVIDPLRASLEELPKPLISECRTSSRRDGKICVMLFGTENKWGWYPFSEIRLINLSGSSDMDGNGVTPSSLRSAKQWLRKTVDLY